MEPDLNILEDRKGGLSIAKQTPSNTMAYNSCQRIKPSTPLRLIVAWSGQGQYQTNALCNILRSTEEAVRGAYYGPGLQLPTEREA